MSLNKYKLGNLMVPYSRKCGISNLTPYQVSGVNKDKEFFEPSHQVGEDTSKYQVVPPRHFACNLMHVGRDCVLPIAYNHSDNDKIVSPAYTVFSLKESCGVLDDYFFIMLKCEEQDRYFWFHADASVRDGMSWNDFCDVEIAVPDITVQQKYVDIYKAIVANQQSYERGLEDLKLVCDGYIEDLRRKIPSEKIGKYIEEISLKNEGKGYEESSIRGISINKEFIPTKADTNGVSLNNYKIVETDQFAFNPNTARMGEKICVALNKSGQEYLVSAIYPVFKINNHDVLLPEYLMMWIKRKEFDRYVRFNSWGSARETFNFCDMAEVEIPIPGIDVQRSIVNIYNAYIARKEINEQLKAQIKDICPILIRGSLEEVK